MTKQTDLRAEATAARLAALSVPPGAPWATEARQAARARLLAMGLPQRRDEYWRFTDPASLNAPDPAPAGVIADDESPLFAATDPLRLTFEDGQLTGADGPAMHGATVETLAAATAADDHWAADLYGRLEAEGQAPVARPFAALATAFATQGVAIRATGQADRPVHLVRRHLDPGADALLRHVVRVEPGASLTLLESGPIAARATSVLEVDVAEGATFHHVRTQGRDRERRAATHVFARVGAGARYRSFTLTLNGALTRNEHVVTLAGEEAVAHVAGAAVGDGAFHHDDTVFVTHAAPGCESRQVFKKVLRHGAVGVFQGKILVRPGAQKTDGYQLSKALLLDDASQFLAKPELEIYADDVRCSHGSTAGGLDDAALFYLRSRGVPLADARDLLSLAFLQEALDEVADEGLAAELRGRIEAWLGRRR